MYYEDVDYCLMVNKRKDYSMKKVLKFSCSTDTVLRQIRIKRIIQKELYDFVSFYSKLVDAVMSASSVVADITKRRSDMLKGFKECIF